MKEDCRSYDHQIQGDRDVFLEFQRNHAHLCVHLEHKRMRVFLEYLRTTCEDMIFHQSFIVSCHPIFLQDYVS